MIEKWQSAKARQGGRQKFESERGRQAELDMQGPRNTERKGVAGETDTQSSTMLLHSAISLRSRQLCGPNSVLFMQKPSQKSARTQGCSGCCSIIHQAEKCILIEVALNLGHHFSQLFFFFLLFFQLCVIHRQTELHLSTLQPHWDSDC